MFYHYRQNNSGGYYRAPAHEVWVEASSSGEANAAAGASGLDFSDSCECCGPRWRNAWPDDGVEGPFRLGYGITRNVMSEPPPNPAPGTRYIWPFADDYAVLDLSLSQERHVLIVYAGGRKEFWVYRKFS